MRNLFLLTFLLLGMLALRAQSPNTISGLQLWLDASDVNGNGSFPGSGSAITNWMDKSGNARNAVASGTVHASFETNRIGSRPALRFTRVSATQGSSFFVPLDIRATTNTDVTIFTVYVPGASGGNQAAWGNDNGGWDRVFFPAYNGTQDGAVSTANGPNTMPVPGAGTTAAVRLATTIYDGNINAQGINEGGIGSRVYLNGQAVNNFNDYTHATAARTDFQVGRDGDDNYFGGEIAEIIVYNRKLTDCEISLINTYLNTKYAQNFTNRPTVGTSGPTTFCTGSSVVLTGYQIYEPLNVQWLRNNTPIAGATGQFYNATQSGDYRVIAYPSGCSTGDTSLPVTVNVVAPPSVTSAASATLCNGATQNYLITSNTPGATFNWQRATVGGIPGNSAAGVTSITETLSNSTSDPITAVYQIRAVANGCQGPLFNYSVTVNPTPFVLIPSSATTCSGSYNRTLTSYANNATFAWSRAAVAGISSPASSGTTSTINEALVNTGGAPVQVTYNIQASINGCSGPAFQHLVTVNPLPTASIVAPTTVCQNSNAAVTFTGAAGVAPYTFTYSVSDGTTTTTGLTVTTQGSSNTATVTVPTASAGLTYTYTLTGVSDANCSNTASGTRSISIQAPGAGTTTITGGTFCGTGTQGIPVNGTTGGSFASSPAGLSLNSFTGQMDLAGSIPGTYTVTYTYTNGPCNQTATATVIVRNIPNATVIGSTSVCQNSTPPTITFSGTNGAAPYTFSYQVGSGPVQTVSSGTGSTATITVPTNTVGITNVTLLSVQEGNGCQKTLTGQWVSVGVKPLPTVTSASTGSVCTGVAQSYMLTSSAGLVTSFTWSRAAVAGISNAAVSGQTTPTINETLQNTTTAPVNVAYTIVPTDNGCTGPAFTYTVTVNPSLVVNSASTGTVCSGTALAYTATSNISNASFTWYRAAVPGITNAAATGNSATINETLVNTTFNPITVSYQVNASANGCGSASFLYTVTVNPAPNATISFPAGTYCTGSTSTVPALLNGSSGGTFSAPGLNINSATGTVNLFTAAPGTYTVTYTIAASGNCAAFSTTTPLTVTALPATPVITTTAANTLQSSAASGNQWYFNGNPIPGATADTLAPTMFGNYTLRVTANGCTSLSSAPVTFTPTAVSNIALERQFRVGPNPVSGQLHIRYAGNAGRFVLRLTGTTGQLLHTASFNQSTSIDMERLPAGLYVVEIRNTINGQVVRKTIVKP